MVTDLPFAAAYLGDTFDLAQTNQPEDIDFSLPHIALRGRICLSTQVSTLEAKD